MTTRQRIVLASIYTSLLMACLDNTIVTIVLTDIARTTGATTAELQAVVDSYLVVFASLLILGGNVCDRVGARRCFLAGTSVFVAGSAMAGAANGIALLVVARVTMGVGGALLIPSIFGLVAATFPPAQRARALSLWGTTVGAAVAIGPVLGGFIAQSWGWHFAFLVNVPVGLLGIAGIWTQVPDAASNPSRRLPIVSAVTATGALAAVVLLIISVPTFDSAAPAVPGLLAVTSVVLGAAFVREQRRRGDGYVDFTLFRRGSFAPAAVGLGILFFVVFGSLFLVARYLQEVLGLAVLPAGLCLLPLAAALLTVSPLSARMARRIGGGRVAGVGLGTAAAGAAILAVLGESSPPVLAAIGLGVIGVGMGLTVGPALALVLAEAPPDRIGMATSICSTLQQVGGALGVAVLGAVLNAAMRSAPADTPFDAGLFVTGMQLACVISVISAGAAGAWCVWSVRSRGKRTESGGTGPSDNSVSDSEGVR